MTVCRRRSATSSAPMRRPPRTGQDPRGHRHPANQERKIVELAVRGHPWPTGKERRRPCKPGGAGAVPQQAGARRNLAGPREAEAALSDDIAEHLVGADAEAKQRRTAIEKLHRAPHRRGRIVSIEQAWQAQRLHREIRQPRAHLRGEDFQPQRFRVRRLAGVDAAGDVETREVGQLDLHFESC